MEKFNLNIPKMGHFLLVKHEKGWLGDQIKNTQIKMGFKERDAIYTHVEVLGGGQHSVCVAPPCTSIIDFTKKYKNRYVKIVRYKGDGYVIRRYKVAFWAASHCNLKYDWRGVIAFIVTSLRDRFNKYFCSENSLWALQKEQPEALDGIKPEKCVPAHFTVDEFFAVVWEGYI